MKLLIPIFILLFLMSCKNDTDINSHNDQSERIEMISRDSSTNTLLEESSSQRDSLAILLNHPIHLPAYKKKYGTSHSGMATNEGTYFKPDTVGFYYEYMLFYKLKKLLETHPSESELLRNFKIITYKYGTQVGNFYDTNEEIIAIECALENSTLGSLDLVGLSKNEVEEKFGTPDRIEGLLSIYMENQVVLTLHYNQKDTALVEWFKYVRVNDTFDVRGELPRYYMSFYGLKDYPFDF